MELKFIENCRTIHDNFNFEKMPKINEQSITSEIIFTNESRRCVLVKIKAYVDSLENKGRAEKINETKSWHLK